MAQQRILSTLFAHNTSPSVREYAARLVNCISCECAGRAYLLQSSNLLSLLWDILTSESGDTVSVFMTRQTYYCVFFYILDITPASTRCDAEIITS